MSSRFFEIKEPYSCEINTITNKKYIDGLVEIKLIMRPEDIKEIFISDLVKSKPIEK